MSKKHTNQWFRFHSKSLALLNGGAAIGMLTTFDRLATVIPIASLKWAMVCFALGLALNGAAIFCSYWTQNTLFQESFGRAKANRHVMFIKLTTAFVTLSLLVFMLGVSLAVFNANGSFIGADGLVSLSVS